MGPNVQADEPQKHVGQVARRHWRWAAVTTRPEISPAQVQYMGIAAGLHSEGFPLQVSTLGFPADMARNHQSVYVWCKRRDAI